MAESRPRSVLFQDQITCPICLGTLDDPVTIPCGHTYCDGCIKDCWKETCKYRCPECRTSFDTRPALNKNTMFADVVEKLTESGRQHIELPTDTAYAGPDDAICSVCTGKIKAVKSCLTCLASYCNNHFHLHTTLSGTKHTVVDALANLQDSICAEHEKLLEIYCTTDSKFICYLCAMGNHREHDTVSVADRAEKQRLLGVAQMKSQEGLQRKQMEAQDLRKAMDSLKMSAQVSVDECERAFSELVRSAERRCAEVTKLIRHQEEAELRRATGLLEEVERDINEREERASEMRRLADMDDHIAFVLSFSSLCGPAVSEDPISTIITDIRSSFLNLKKSVSDLQNQLEERCKQEIGLSYQSAGFPSASMTGLKRANSFSGRSYQNREEEKNEPLPVAVFALHRSKSVTSIVTGAGIGTGLKWTSSFSSWSRRKLELTGPVAVPTVRRSNSVTSIFHSAEVMVSQLMWSHMKEAYSTRLDDMMSDLQMSERKSETDNCIKVVLKGAESSVMTSCQQELQKLVSMVSSDFTIVELRLSNLGVADGDEVFEACCVDLRARFRKVSQRLVNGSLYLIGPKLLCTQVNTALREVFSGEMTQKDSSNLNLKLGPSSKDALGYNLTPEGHLSSTIDAEKNTNRKTEPRKLSSQTTENTVRMKFDNTRTVDNITAELSQPVVKKDPVVREKVERSGSISGRTSKKYTSSLSPSVDTNREAAAQWLDETSSPSPRSELMKQTNLHSGLLKTSCLLCNRSLPSQPLTVCGLSLCVKCFSQHGHCKLCFKKGTERERAPQDQKKPERTKAGQDQASAVKEKEPGIRGNMNIVELQLTLAGHVRDTTARITYLIPDGIQAEGHPYPGSPFRGGFFEAYLPLSARGKSLLTCLKRAFQHGLTFTISPSSKVVWHNIPHKTKMEGGKSGNGYPDSSYLNRLSEALKAHGIEGVPAAVTVEKNKP